MLNVVPLKLHVPVLAAMPCLFIQERRVKTGRRGGAGIAPSSLVYCGGNHKYGTPATTLFISDYVMRA